MYSASKAYVLSLSQSLAAQLAPRGVRVQAVLHPSLSLSRPAERYR